MSGDAADFISRSLVLTNTGNSSGKIGPVSKIVAALSVVLLGSPVIGLTAYCTPLRPYLLCGIHWRSEIFSDG